MYLNYHRAQAFGRATFLQRSVKIEYLMRNLNLLVLGLIVGFFSAALGIGGGVIMVSALILFFNYGIKRAIGTSLATIVPTAFVGIIAHYIIKSGNIKFIIALFIVMGSIIGAKLGAGLANKMSSKLLTKLFASLLFFVGLKLIGIINFPTEPVSNTSAYPLLIVLGLFAGSASALFGIGGGVIMVPVLNLFFGLSIYEAVATSLTVILPTTLAGVIFHKKFDNIDPGAIIFLIPTALIGAVFGAIVANSLPAATLQIIFGVFIILCSIKMFMQEE
ncbi:MAG TPA: sulfite exporter TauE/SafE family protein [Methanosarcinales archaeon]|nr:sulfite exporter TauE/SafE family protein [Methanosarcinales archaeon]